MAIFAFVAIETSAGIGECRALMSVKLKAVSTLLAVSQRTKGRAVHSSRADANVGEATIFVVTTGVLEMQTSGCVMRSSVVGKRARIAL